MSFKTVSWSHKTVTQDFIWYVYDTVYPMTHSIMKLYYPQSSQYFCHKNVSLTTLRHNQHLSTSFYALLTSIWPGNFDPTDFFAEGTILFLVFWFDRLTIPGKSLLWYLGRTYRIKCKFTWFRESSWRFFWACSIMPNTIFNTITINNHSANFRFIFYIGLLAISLTSKWPTSP